MYVGYHAKLHVFWVEFQGSVFILVLTHQHLAHETFNI